MRRNLAGEDGVVRAHALLDESVADPIHERRPSGPLDGLGNGPARAHVVDDLLAWRLREHGLGEQRSREVAGDELARVVHEEAAVGVAVVRDSEVCFLLHDLRDDELAILRQERVRLVVREAPVGLEVAANDVELRQSLEDGREHRSGHPVRGVHDDAERSNRIDVDE